MKEKKPNLKQTLKKPHCLKRTKESGITGTSCMYKKTI